MHHSQPGWRKADSKTPEAIFQRLSDAFVESHEMTPKHDAMMGDALDDLRQLLTDEELL